MSWSHLRQFDEKAIRYFTVACEELSVRGAAERLRIAPTAVGKKLKELEEDLGVTLLTRTSKGTVPTAIGKILLEYLQARHRQDAGIVSNLLELTRLKRGHLTVGIGEGFLADFVMTALARFRDSHPEIRVSLYVSSTEEILNGLETGTMDIAISFYPPDIDLQNITSVFETSMHFSCFIPISWNVPSGKSASLAELENLPCALMTREYSARHLIDAAERAAGVRLDVAMETNSLHALKHFIAAGSGMTIMPNFVLQETVKSNIARCIPLIDPILNGVSVRVLVSNIGNNDPTIAALLPIMRDNMELLRL